MHQLNESQRAQEQIHAIAREIERLAEAGGPPETFFPNFLGRLVTVLRAPAGAIWLRSTTGRINPAPFCEYNLGSVGVMASPEAVSMNMKLLDDVLQTGEARIKSPDVSTAELPTPHVYMLAALNKAKECVGVIQIFQRPEVPRESLPGYLQFMEAMCGFASRYLQDQDAAKVQVTPDEFWKQFEQMTLRMGRTLDPKEVAATAANDGRQLIGCDRCSVVLYRFGRARVISVSGTETVHRRSNLIRAMARLATRVIRAREPLMYAGKLGEFPPQIEGPLADYVTESHSRLVHIIPLFEPDSLTLSAAQEKDAPRKPPKRRPIGALVVEQHQDGRVRAGFQDKATLVADHTATALNNSIRYHRLFLLPVWEWLGRVMEKVRGRWFWRILLGTAAVAALVTAMVKVPWDYRVQAKGRLMPIEQRDIFAPWDGRVEQVLVKHGQRVTRGDLVVKLRNEQLETQLLSASNQYEQDRQEEASLRGQYEAAAREGQRDERLRLQGQLEQSRIKLAHGQLQVEALQSQIAQLEVRAPADGVVATFQLEQNLANRPVQRGELLLETMDDLGDWHLEVEIPDHRMGHIFKRRDALAKAKQSELLPVEFMLATSTEVTYEASLDPTQDTATRTVLAETEGSVVEANLTIKPADFERLKDLRRIGADVTVWINCGEYPLGYVLFGDVIEFVQKRSIFW